MRFSASPVVTRGRDSTYWRPHNVDARIGLPRQVLSPLQIPHNDFGLSVYHERVVGIRSDKVIRRSKLLVSVPPEGLVCVRAQWVVVLYGLGSGVDLEASERTTAYVD